MASLLHIIFIALFLISAVASAQTPSTDSATEMLLQKARQNGRVRVIVITRSAPRDETEAMRLRAEIVELARRDGSTSIRVMRGMVVAELTANAILELEGMHKFLMVEDQLLSPNSTGRGSHQFELALQLLPEAQIDDVIQEVNTEIRVEVVQKQYAADTYRIVITTDLGQSDAIFELELIPGVKIVEPVATYQLQRHGLREGVVRVLFSVQPLNEPPLSPLEISVRRDHLIQQLRRLGVAIGDQTKLAGTPLVVATLPRNRIEEVMATGAATDYQIEHPLSFQ